MLRPVEDPLGGHRKPPDQLSHPQPAPTTRPMINRLDSKLHGLRRAPLQPGTKLAFWEKGWLSIPHGRRTAILHMLADAVRTRRVSSRQLVERVLERISRLDGHLNAVVALRADLALGEAQELDVQVTAGGDPGP